MLPSGGIEVTLPSDAAGEKQGHLSHSSDFRVAPHSRGMEEHRGRLLSLATTPYGR